MFRTLLITTIVLACLLAGGVVGFSYAQTIRPPFTAGHIFSGKEIGFRVEGMHPGQPSHATLLIKIAGEWHEFTPSLDVTPLAK